jgi:hypothetical protein
MESIKNRLMREAGICSVYFMISILSAIWAYDRFIEYRNGDSDGPAELNAMGMVRIMWGDYLVPFICAFAILCALRFFVDRSPMVYEEKSYIFQSGSVTLNVL